MKTMKLDELLFHLRNLEAQYNELGEKQLAISTNLSRASSKVLKESFSRQIDSILCEMIEVRDKIKLLRTILDSSDEFKHLQSLEEKYKVLGEEQLILSNKLSTENNPVVKESCGRQIDSILCDMIELRNQIRFLRQAIVSIDY